MIITGIENKLLLLNDTDLSTIKQIDHECGNLNCGIYHKERDLIYLGTDKGLIEFYQKQLVIKRELKTKV